MSNDTTNNGNNENSTPATETPATETPATEYPAVTSNEAAPPLANDPMATITSASTTAEAAPVTPAPEEINVTIAGAFEGSYTGPAGKTLHEMFPTIGDKKFQVRHSGRMVSHTKPWMISAALKAVEHGTHG